VLTDCVCVDIFHRLRRMQLLNVCAGPRPLNGKLCIALYIIYHMGVYRFTFHFYIRVSKNTLHNPVIWSQKHRQYVSNHIYMDVQVFPVTIVRYVSFGARQCVLLQ